jgi:excisionase family DNA binding protein
MASLTRGDLKKKRLLNVREAAFFLGIAPGTIYNQVSRNSKKRFPIPFTRVGKLIRFDIDDLEKFLKAGSEKEQGKRIVLDGTVDQVDIDPSFKKAVLRDILTDKNRTLRRTPGPGLQMT